MGKTPAPQVTLQRPDGPDRDALHAGLLALQCIPVNRPPPGAALTERLALDRAASTLDLPALAADELDRYLRAVPTAPSSLSPRVPIRARTGLDAEALADLLPSKPDIRDRCHHLKRYPVCFLGSEAVRQMRSHFRLESPQVVEVGRALQALGPLYHVTHEQAFADEALFFRLRAPAQLPNVNLGLVLQSLRDRLMVVDRSHLGKDHPSCWIGQEAVDTLCAKRNFFYSFTDSLP